MDIDLATLAALLADAAQRGIEVGRKGTMGTSTASGIAYHVLDDAGILPH